MKLTPLFVIVIIFGTANNIRINTITNTINTIINPAAKFFQIFDIVKNGKSLYDDINDKIFGNISQEDRVMKILQEVGRISNKLEQIEMNMNLLSNDELKTVLMRHTEFYTNYLQLSEALNEISSKMQKLVTYSENIDHIERHTLEDFATWAVSHQLDSVQGLLDKIQFIINGQSKSFYSTFTQFLQTKGNACYSRTSPQQIIYKIYNAVNLAGLKGFVMKKYSWLLLKSLGKGNFKAEAELMQKSFESRYMVKSENMQNFLNSVDQTIRTCEPSTYEEGRTHIEVTRLIQGFYENESNLNSIGTCSDYCENHNKTRVYDCSPGQLCRVQPKCNGGVHDCFYRDSYAKICKSNTGSRRYDYFDFWNVENYGNAENRCFGKNIATAGSWLRGFFNCDYCFCLCDERGPLSDRYFSLHPSVSDIDNNEVVTGVRFIKKNRIIHLQAQAGKLLPGGLIDQSTVSWIPLPDINVYRSKDGVDYHTLNYYNRKIDLNDVDLADSYVVTGVALKVSGSHLYLEVRQNKMNFATGELYSPTKWVIRYTTVNSQKLQLYKPNIPTENGQISVVDSYSGQYVEFTHSDFERDAAQTTVPFLDAQNVVSTPAVPLGGVGLYHKGFSRSGGFIAPSIKTLNMSPFV